jgi:hypothetical protein
MSEVNVEDVWAKIEDLEIANMVQHVDEELRPRAVVKIKATLGIARSLVANSKVACACGRRHDELTPDDATPIAKAFVILIDMLGPDNIAQALMANIEINRRSSHE